ncbi:MAG: acetyl-CoA carboxylase biotin carboxylase subunit [Planctomycetota bacterium]|nr:acetyl-CoA carboxylase biotin carboxylase subunit [Planctomycetota bacterium]
MPYFRRILVANRGEIALRVIRTAHELGIESVAVYSDADRNALHVRRSSHALHIGGSEPSESYLDADKILDACRRSGADAVHPGYGFLSENAAFAQACTDAGIEFLGPPPDAIAKMGDKVAARRIAQQAGLPLVPGLQEDIDESQLAGEARKIGFPVMLKAAAGGGGKGIRIVEDEAGLVEAWQMARAEAKGAFNDDRVYLEKFVTRPRHVEIQVFADKHGNVVAYGERECSVQRRHQKLVEESPCVAITEEMRAAMSKAACDLASAVGYVGAGTVEFLFSEGEFYFLEMNTRLQVEHPVTEMRFGVDLVEEQIRVGAGEELRPVPQPQGHAIEVRVNAEDPTTYFPSLGRITRLNMPGGPGVRLDTSLFRGLEVTPYYDSMLGKVIVHAEDRKRAIARCLRVLRELRIVGVATSVAVATRTLASSEFASGDYDTAILERVDDKPPASRGDLVMLAAAAARFLGAERAGAAGAGAGESSARTPRWALIGRAEQMRRPLK